MTDAAARAEATAHTPGPWEQCGTAVWSPTANAMICELSTVQPFANACLIAAAPDLASALREAALQIEYLHEKYGETGSGNGTLARARAALAKAGIR